MQLHAHQNAKMCGHVGCSQIFQLSLHSAALLEGGMATWLALANKMWAEVLRTTSRREMKRRHTLPLAWTTLQRSLHFAFFPSAWTTAMFKVLASPSAWLLEWGDQNGPGKEREHGFLVKPNRFQSRESHALKKIYEYNYGHMKLIRIK